MKIIRGFKVRGFILAAAFSLVWVSPLRRRPTRSFLPHRPQQQDSDSTLGTWWNSASALASTTPGRWWVVLTRLEGTHAFITGPNGMGMRDLGTLGGVLQPCLWHQRRRAGGGLFLHGWRRATTCFHHRPRWDGHERPWHFGR